MSALTRMSVLVCALSASCGSSPAQPNAELTDASFTAYLDDDGDGLSFDDAARTVRFSDFFTQNRPDTHILMLNIAAGWCGACQHEAPGLSDLAATYGPRGVAVLTLVVQKEDGSAADSAFARLWAETFQLSIPVLVDSEFVSSRYFDASALPATLFVSAVDGRILATVTGAAAGDDPFREYRRWLDSHLAH